MGNGDHPLRLGDHGKGLGLCETYKLGAGPCGAGLRPLWGVAGQFMLVSEQEGVVTTAAATVKCCVVMCYSVWWFGIIHWNGWLSCRALQIIVRI